MAEWVEFKCKVVNDFVSEAWSALKETRADTELGIYVVPDVNGLTEPLTGQRTKDLAQLVDWIAPILYHNILLQPPSWVASALAPVVKVAGKKTLPVLQAEFEPRSDRRWRLGISDVGRQRGAKRFRRSRAGTTSPA